MRCIRAQHTFATGAVLLFAVAACEEEQSDADLQLATAALAVVREYPTPIVNQSDPLLGPQIMAHAPSNKCLDVTDFKTSNGSGVQLYSCLNGDNQLWTYDDTTQTLKGLQSKRCLDVPSNNSANGTRPQIWDCNGLIQQRWTLTSSGQLKSVGTGKCLDVAGYGSADGAALQIYDCHGDGNQRWQRGFTVLRNAYSSGCLSTAGGATGGGQVQDTSCSPTPPGLSHDWLLANTGALVSSVTLGLSCLRQSSTAGAVQNGACDSQALWRWRSDATLQHLSTGKCLNVSGGPITSVQLAPCNGSGNQIFSTR
jgi:Ricin-type beta-trefoil lectin domain